MWLSVCRPAACSCFGPFKSVPVCLVFVSVEKSLSSLMSDKSVTPLQQMVVKMLHFFPCEKKRFIFLSKWSVKGVVGVIVEWLCEPQPHRKCVTKTLQTSDLTEIYRCAQRLEKVRKDCRYSRNSYSYIIKINTNLTVMWPQLWEATMNPFTMEQMFHHDNWYDDETMSGDYGTPGTGSRSNYSGRSALSCFVTQWCHDLGFCSAQQHSRWKSKEELNRKT